MFHRICTPSLDHSFFLFGARGTGKSTLIKKLLTNKNVFYLDLLDFKTEDPLSKNPGLFSEWIDALDPQTNWVFVDEVQKVPPLLNEVHRQIEKNQNLNFILTGSSARKLKKEGVNLLAGRAFTYHLHPLTHRELGSHFNLSDVLHYGSLPKIFSLKNETAKKRFLRSYTQTYLQSEIQMEGVVRNLVGFRKFLPLAALENGLSLSYTNFAQDVGVDLKTIISYFQILEDTLIGFTIPAYDRSVRQRQRTHPKFYFFDTGVKRALAGELNIPLVEGQTAFGRAFEHFVMLEIIRQNDYEERDFKFSYFATNDLEIDLIVDRPGLSPWVIEIKSSSSVKNKDLTAVRSIANDVPKAQAVCLCRETHQRTINGVHVFPWQEGIAALFSGK